jgi:hypothetical protein
MAASRVWTDGPEKKLRAWESPFNNQGSLILLLSLCSAGRCWRGCVMSVTMALKRSARSTTGVS